MLIILVQGGLGNQMFEYATGYSLSKKNSIKMQLYKGIVEKDSFKYQLDDLNLFLKDIAEERTLPRWISLFVSSLFIHRIINHIPIKTIKLGNWIYATQKDKTIIHKLNYKANNVVLDGYWQNPLNFSTYEMDIQQQFTPAFELSKGCEAWKRKIQACESVSLHIRRGDYLDKKNQEYRIKEDYYNVAIDYIKNKKPDAVFFVFSNDKEWVRSHYPSFEIVDFESSNKDLEEMYLISQCNNNINANSTYSWWGAYLNKNPQKIIINPDRPWNRDMIPDNWIIVKNSEETNPEEVELIHKGD